MSATLRLNTPILDSLASGKGRRIFKGGGKVVLCPNAMVFIVNEVVSSQYT